MNVVSPKIRTEFQEYLVANSVLRDIETLFNNRDLDPTDIPPESLPSGARRSLIARYYAGVEWANPKSARKVLNVYADILGSIKESLDHPATFRPQSDLPFLQQRYDKIIRWLRSDGFVYDGNKILFQGETALEFTHDAVDLLDANQFSEYVDRIKLSIEDDPALAIGSTKELVESVLKTILAKLDSNNLDKDDDVPKLLRKAQKALKLAPDDIDNAAKGADIIKVLLSNLGTVVVKLTELRNLYGTGHGSEKKRRGMEPRHAKLAVGAGITLATFLLDTFKNRSIR